MQRLAMFYVSALVGKREYCARVKAFVLLLSVALCCRTSCNKRKAKSLWKVEENNCVECPKLLNIPLNGEQDTAGYDLK